MAQQHVYAGGAGSPPRGGEILQADRPDFAVYEAKLREAAIC
jgi:hypothetical protein